MGRALFFLAVGSLSWWLLLIAVGALMVDTVYAVVDAGKAMDRWLERVGLRITGLDI